jgi:hypothetical protein
VPQPDHRRVARLLAHVAHEDPDERLAIARRVAEDVERQITATQNRRILGIYSADAVRALH